MQAILSINLQLQLTLFIWDIPVVETNIKKKMSKVIQEQSKMRKSPCQKVYYSYTRAGQYRDSGPAYFGKFTSMGTLGSLKRR